MQLLSGTPYKISGRLSKLRGSFQWFDILGSYPNLKVDFLRLISTMLYRAILRQERNKPTSEFVEACNDVRNQFVFIQSETWGAQLT